MRLNALNSLYISVFNMNRYNHEPQFSAFNNSSIMFSFIFQAFFKNIYYNREFINKMPLLVI